MKKVFSGTVILLYLKKPLKYASWKMKSKDGCLVLPETTPPSILADFNELAAAKDFTSFLCSYFLSFEPLLYGGPVMTGGSFQPLA